MTELINTLKNLPSEDKQTAYDFLGKELSKKDKEDELMEIKKELILKYNLTK